MSHEQFLEFAIPSSGDIAIDVGANDGQYIERLLGRFSRVVAFEPQTSCFRALRAKFQDVDLRRVACGAAKGAGALKVTSDKRFSGVATLLDAHPHGYSLPGAEAVVVDTIDGQLVGIHGTVDFLKIDVEGGDIDALRGAAGIVRRDLPRIILEEHVNGDIERAVDLLNAFAPGCYSFETVNRQNISKPGAFYRWLVASS